MYSLSWGFPGGAVVKNLPANAGDMVQSLGRETWQATVHGIAKAPDTTQRLKTTTTSYSIGNSTQCSVMTYMQKESEKEWIRV